MMAQSPERFLYSKQLDDLSSSELGLYQLKIHVKQ